MTQLDRLAGLKGTVIIAREGRCPISERYGPKIKALEDTYTKLGFSFIYLYVGTVDIAERAKGDMTKYKLKGFYTVDPQLEVSRHFSLKTTTESLVFNSAGQLIYRGAVDNLQSLSGTNPGVAENFLQNALDAELKGLPVSLPLTDSPGCFINYPNEKATSQALNFNEDIYPLFERKCISCHLPENNFVDLSDYNSVRGRASTIRYVLENNIMPPWNVRPGLGPWVNDLSLSIDERKKIFQWLDAGLPEGTSAKKVSVNWSSEWRTGEPDQILPLPKAVKIKADGTMPYQYFIIKTNFKKEMWVKSYEILTKANLVHHLKYYVLENPKDLKPDHFPLNFSASFAWSLGEPPTIFPTGVGTRIPAGAVLGLTIHYQPNGTATIDRDTRLGLKFYSQKPPRERRKFGFTEKNLVIPPGAKDYTTTSLRPIEEDLQLSTLAIHMHLRGKAAQVNWLKPNGKKELLLDVTKYNTNHQFLYEFKTPLLIPKGSTLECVNHFDNSKDNPLNPDPLKEVRWGEQIGDEMSVCIAEGFNP